MKFQPLYFFFFVCSLILGQSALAQSAADPLSANIEAFIVEINADGQEVLRPAETANPGDVILYRAVFENRSAEPLLSIKPVIPIPAGLVYIDGSAVPEADSASLNGRDFQLLDAAQSESDWGLSPDQFRALQWQVEKLEPSASFTAELRVKLAQ